MAIIKFLQFIHLKLTQQSYYLIMDSHGQIAFTPTDNSNTRDYLKQLFTGRNSPSKDNSTDSSSTSSENSADQPHSDATLEQQGINEAIKQHSKEEETTKQKLDHLIENSNIELYKTQNSRLFNLYPDIMVIDTTKVSISFRAVFGSKQVKTIYIKDLTEVIIESTPIFATLKLRDDRFDMNEDGHLLVIQSLRKPDAQKAHDILQGLIVAREEEIDITKVHTDDLAQKIEQLGKVATHK